jgi:glycosyltransferase involved in cell wall biosynthesis
VNVLFVVPYLPSQVRTRPLHLIRALSEAGHRVTLASLWKAPHELEQVRRAIPWLAGIIGVQVTRWREVWNLVRAVPTGEPLQAHISWHAALARAIGQHVRTHPVDVVHVEHLRGVRYGLALRALLDGAGVTGPPIVWDSVDCITDLFRMAEAAGPARPVRLMARLERPRTERYEGRVIRAFPRVIVTTSRDREGLLRLAAQSPAESDEDRRRVVVIPNGVDLVRFAPSSEPRELDTLVFSGKMSYHANVAAAVRCVEDVLPRVRVTRPSARLLIVGQNPPLQVRRLARVAGVTVTGTVDDVRPFLQRAAVALAPMPYGVGIQNKVLEAMACATPVVASGVAVQPMSLRPGIEVVTAEDADAFASAVVDLLGDAEARRRLGAAGRRYVETHHAWRAIGERLATVYREAAA